MDEAAWKERVGDKFVPFESGGAAILRAGDCPAAQIDPEADAGGIHDFYRARQVLGGAVDVLVEVNGPVLAPPLLGCLGTGAVDGYGRHEQGAGADDYKMLVEFHTRRVAGAIIS